MASSLNGTGITFSNATTQSSARTGPNITTVVTAGSGTFTIPAGITALKVTVIGGGSGSTGANGGCCGDGSIGGHGGVAVKWLTGLTPGLTLSYTVGAGSSGSVGLASTSAGGTSSVSSGTQVIATISATGGVGATYSGPVAGRGGSGSGGTFNFVAPTQARINGGAPSYTTGTPAWLGGQPSNAINGNANANGQGGLYPGAGGGPARSTTTANVSGGAGAAGGVFFEW